MMSHLNISTLATPSQLFDKRLRWQIETPHKATSFASFSNLPPYLRARIAGWVSNGVEKDVLIKTLEKLGSEAIPGSTSWLDAFSTAGSTFETEAKKSTGEDACAQFIQASAFYAISRWPHYFTPDSRGNYEQSLHAFEQAQKFFNCSFDSLTITVEKSTLKAHLYGPLLKTAEPHPMIIVTGGMDAWKIDPEVQTIITLLLSEGFGVCSIDMPGTGENEILLGTDAIQAYKAVVETLKSMHKVDPLKIGIYGLSFGGHWAVRSLLAIADIKAAVNVGGPIHHAFQEENYARLEKGAQMNVAQCFGKNWASFDAAEFAKLSLEQHKAQPGNTSKILSINGALDELVPFNDIAYIDTIGINHDKLIYGNDRHVASYHQRQHLPFAASWLKNALAAL